MNKHMMSNVNAAEINLAVNQHSSQAPVVHQHSLHPLVLKTPIRMNYSSSLMNYHKCSEDQQLAYEQLRERQLRAQLDEYTVLMTKKNSECLRQCSIMENHRRAQQSRYTNQRSVPSTNQHLHINANGLQSQIPLANHQ